MNKILDEATALESRGNGCYVREIDEGPFWGAGTPHGGYLMALMLHAMEREVGEPERVPRMLSHHFLGTIKPGSVSIDVTVERAGRVVTSVSARLSTRDRLVGLTTAIFSKESAGPIFLDDAMPEVAAPGEPDRDMVAFYVPKVHHGFEFHRRFGADGAGVPCEDGGWIVALDAGPWDHRFALIASDLWIPPVMRNPELMAATPSLHHVVHFGPDVTGESGMPLLVHHRMSSGAQGVTDEDIKLWAEDGRLLMSAKQLRAAIPPADIVGRDFT